MAWIESEPSPRRLNTDSVMIVVPIKRADIDAEDGDDRRQRGAQAVLDHDRPPIEALGPRRADVVLVHRLEHVRAGQPRVERGEQERQAEPGQEQAEEPLDRIHRDVDVAAVVRQPPQRVHEEQQRDRAGEEDGERDGGERTGHAGAVRDRARLETGQCAHEEAADEPQDRGADAEADRHGKRLPDERRYEFIAAERVSEAREGAGHRSARAVGDVLAEEAGEVGPVLRRERLVEAEPVGQGLQQLGRRRCLADVVVHGRRLREQWDGLEDQERHQAHGDQHEHHADQAAHDEADHVGLGPGARPVQNRPGTLSLSFLRGGDG